MNPAKELIARFWSKTIRRDGCFVWTGAQKIGRDGSRRYGLFAGGERLAKREGRRRMVQAHRFIYEQCIEPLGDRILMHTCDTPDGTQAQNVADCVIKGRNRGPVLKTHCSKGHPFDSANTYVRPSGHRECRICREAYHVTFRSKHG